MSAKAPALRSASNDRLIFGGALALSLALVWFASHQAVAVLVFAAGLAAKQKKTCRRPAGRGKKEFVLASASLAGFEVTTVGRFWGDHRGPAGAPSIEPGTPSTHY